MRKRSIELGTWLATAIVANALGGCGSQAGGATGNDSSEVPSEVEHIGVTENAIATKTWTDPTGRITINVTQCDWVGPSQMPSDRHCAVPSDFARVGGGAEIEGSAQPGALLVASYPREPDHEWAVVSRDHVQPYPHRVRAYAIGMKLAGVSTAALRSMVQVFDSPASPLGELPSSTVSVPAGYIMLGGGGYVVSSGAGLFLTASYPSSDTSWTVSAKDHEVFDRGNVFASAIGIPACPAGFGGCLKSERLQSSQINHSGYTNLLAGLSKEVFSCPGARVTYTGAGRMLTDVYPLMNTTDMIAAAWSKDHDIVDAGGQTSVYFMHVHM